VAEWSEFFVAVAGASAALAGLVIVAVFALTMLEAWVLLVEILR
jgi:hypothetical protein